MQAKSTIEKSLRGPTIWKSKGWRVCNSELSYLQGKKGEWELGHAKDFMFGNFLFLKIHANEYGFVFPFKAYIYSIYTFT